MQLGVRVTDDGNASRLDHNGGAASADGQGEAARPGTVNPDAGVRISWIPGLGSCPGGVDVALIDPGTGRISQERALSVDDARRWAAQRAAVTGDGTIIEDLERLLASNGIGGRSNGGRPRWIGDRHQTIEGASR